jgi:hypothetical protein
MNRGHAEANVKSTAAAVAVEGPAFGAISRARGVGILPLAN